MSYATATTIRAWTDYSQRNPLKFIVTAYLNNVQVDQTTVYTEQAADIALATYINAAQRTKIYDQVVVTQASINVPSTKGSD
jgi:hypothetical protein